jgi:hypothetical protein
VSLQSFSCAASPDLPAAGRELISEVANPAILAHIVVIGISGIASAMEQP